MCFFFSFAAPAAVAGFGFVAGFVFFFCYPLFSALAPSTTITASRHTKGLPTPPSTNTIFFSSIYISKKTTDFAFFREEFPRDFFVFFFASLFRFTILEQREWDRAISRVGSGFERRE